MKTRFRPFFFVVLACMVTFLSSLACSIDFGGTADNDVSAEQTLVALQMTQAALEEPPEEPEDEPVEPEEAPDVDYEGISFSFDEAIAANVIPATVPGQNMGEDYMPGETYPTHFEFTFTNYAVQDHFHTPKIIVYPIDEFRAISPYASDIIDSMLQALSNHPGGGNMSDLPFLPMWNAAQVFSAKVEYFDFQNGSGVRYLTMFGQALYPVDNQNLFYTYQGITYDGRYYISAVMPVTHAALPFDGGSDIDDWEEFSNNWETYITDTIFWLEEQTPSSFFPNLDLFGEMMASLLVDR